MWKNILSLSILILSLTTLVHALKPAHAQLGPSTSQGTNPLFSNGGYCGSSTSHTISAQSGQKILISDVIISAQYGDSLEIVFTTSGGSEVGRFKAWNYQNYGGGSIIDTQLAGGIIVPEGEDLTISLNGRGTYTFSGRYTHP